MTDQPTPTSSLDEAAYLAFHEWIGSSDGSMNPETAFYTGWFAARAEVIREVEAALDEVCLYLETFDTSEDAHELTARLRALSQGGEERRVK